MKTKRKTNEGKVCPISIAIHTCIIDRQRWGSYFSKVTCYLLLLPTTKNISLQLHISYVCTTSTFNIENHILNSNFLLACYTAGNH